MTCSIVVPTYNSGKWIASSIDRILSVMSSSEIDFELVMVNDGSADNTLDILKHKAAGDARIRVVSDTKNYGQQRATFLGILESKGDFMVTIDDDMEYEPADILLLYNFALRNNFDLAYGVPLIIKQGGWQKIFYTVYLSALRSANEKRKTSFRIINRKIVQQLRTYADSTPFILDFYLGKIANSIGFLNVRYYPNTTSRYSAFKYLKLYLNARHLKKSKWHNP